MSPFVSRQDRSQTPAATLTLLLATALILAARVPDAFRTPQFIAEDLPIFFLGQRESWIPQLLLPVEGYLDVAPRLIAWLASPFSALSAPFVYAICAIFVAAASITYVSFRAREVFHPLATAIALSLAPVVSWELPGIATNAHWYLQLVLAAACLLPRPNVAVRSALSRTLEFGFVVCAALTGPFCILVTGLLALFGLATWGLRLCGFGGRFGLSEYLARLDRRCIAIVLAGAVVQLGMLWAHPVHHPPGSAAPIWQHLDSVIGVGLQSHLLGHRKIAASTFILVELGFLAAALLFQKTTAHRLACMLLLSYGVAVLLAGIVKMSAIRMPVQSFNLIDRYFFALVAVHWMMAWRLCANIPGGQWLGLPAMSAALLGLSLSNPKQLRRPPLPDLHWSAYARKIDAGESVVVPVNPIPWKFLVPGRTVPDRLFRFGDDPAGK